MIDFHSHILPQMDDGSRSAEESIALLRESARQGVTTICATPHFYAEENPPQVFLQRRREAAKRLTDALPQGEVTRFSPRIVLGAEVHYFTGISHSEEILCLRLGRTRVLLVEMPFERWNHRMIDEILRLNERQDIQVILAHIERYFSFTKRDTIEGLLGSGILLQSNAEFFLRRPGNRKALQMLDRGEISVLGSDCHRMDTRPPRLGEAAEVIEKKLGRQPLDRMEWIAGDLLEGGKA